MAFKTMLNLEKQFTFYASYHNQVLKKRTASKHYLGKFFFAQSYFYNVDIKRLNKFRRTAFAVLK